MKKSPVFAILTALSATAPLGCGDSGSNLVRLDDAPLVEIAEKTSEVETAPTQAESSTSPA